MADLSPHFIEICWRVRLDAVGDGLCARYTTTAVRRCLSEHDSGDVGDPWTPVDRPKGTALTVGRNGWDYRLLSRVLFDFEPAAAQVASPSDADTMLFAAYALARGQGKTEGLHERMVPLPKPIRLKLGMPAGRASLASRASSRVTEAALMRDKVLRPALGRLRGGVPGRDAFDARVDEVFFEDLFATAERDDDQARLLFEQRISEIAWTELQAALARSGMSGTHRLRDISDAERIFSVCHAKHFPDIATSTRTDPRGVEA
jgi:CRISPR system Cascade subunit CasA